MNIRDPNIEPCGTPHFTLFQEELIPFNSTLCILLRRYDLKQDRHVRIPYHSNLLIKMSWFIVSNAFLRSRKKLMFSFWFRRVISVSWTNASRLLCFVKTELLLYNSLKHSMDEYSRLYMTLSKILLHILKRGIGLKLFLSSLDPSLWSGKTLAFISASEKRLYWMKD